MVSVPWHRSCHQRPHTSGRHEISQPSPRLRQEPSATITHGPPNHNNIHNRDQDWQHGQATRASSRSQSTKSSDGCKVLRRMPPPPAPKEPWCCAATSDSEATNPPVTPLDTTATHRICDPQPDIHHLASCMLTNSRSVERASQTHRLMFLEKRHHM